MNASNLLQAAGMFLIPFLIVVISILLGRYWGLYNSRKLADIKQEQIGSVVGTVFALLAFMLAFTFQIAANRYDARKELLLEEVTNIRTAYLRAGLVPEPFRSETRELLVDYVDIRIAIANDPSTLDAGIARSQKILGTLWNFTETLAEQDRSSEVYAMYTSSVNDLVDNYNQRISMTLEYRIPPTVLWILFIITALSMITLGYQLGISGKGSFKLNMLLATVFALVVFLILALDHPEAGLAKLNQKPMLTLQQQLQAK